MVKTGSHTVTKYYDCMECGKKHSVYVIGKWGYCQTPGCIHQEPIQFVYKSRWAKPKACRTGRNMLEILQLDKEKIKMTD